VDKFENGYIGVNVWRLNVPDVLGFISLLFYLKNEPSSEGERIMAVTMNSADETTAAV